MNFKWKGSAIWTLAIGSVLWFGFKPSAEFMMIVFCIALFLLLSIDWDFIRAAEVEEIGKDKARMEREAELNKFLNHNKDCDTN